MPPSFLFSDPIVLFWWKIPISFKSNTYRKHWINTCNKKKIVSCLIMTPRYDYTPLLIYYLITRFSLAIWLSLSKNDQYSLLDWTCWIFFSVFSLFFGLFARAILLLHMNEKEQSRFNLLLILHEEKEGWRQINSYESWSRALFREQ